MTESKKYGMVSRLTGEAFSVESEQLIRAFVKRKVAFSIILAIASWFLMLLCITKDLELSFLLMFLGVLITIEITDEFLTPYFKKRMNILIFIFFIIFVFIIGRRFM